MTDCTTVLAKTRPHAGRAGLDDASLPPCRFFPADDSWPRRPRHRRTAPPRLRDDHRRPNGGRPGRLPAARQRRARPGHPHRRGPSSLPQLGFRRPGRGPGIQETGPQLRRWGRRDHPCSRAPTGYCSAERSSGTGGRRFRSRRRSSGSSSRTGIVRRISPYFAIDAIPAKAGIHDTVDGNSPGTVFMDPGSSPG